MESNPQTGETLHDLRVSDWLGTCFWIGAVLSAAGTFLVGVRNGWLTTFTFFAAYVLGGIGGLLTIFLVLRIPSVRHRYEAESGLTYVDLFMPYFIAELLASITILPLACKRPHFPAARKHHLSIRIMKHSQSGYPQDRQRGGSVYG